MNSIREQGQDGCTCAGGQGQGGHGQRKMSPSGFSEEAALEMNLRDVIFFFLMNNSQPVMFVDSLVETGRHGELSLTAKYFFGAC